MCELDRAPRQAQRLFFQIWSPMIICALLVAAAVPLGGQQSSQPPNLPKSPASTSPQSDRDACTIGKDHESCKRYYRSLCLDGDASGCAVYASELSKDCPKQANAKSPEDNAVAKRCSQKIQCWQDRALSLTMTRGTCAADPASPNCEAARSQVTTGASCDSQ